MEISGRPYAQEQFIEDATALCARFGDAGAEVGQCKLDPSLIPSDMLSTLETRECILHSAFNLNLVFLSLHPYTAGSLRPPGGTAVPSQGLVVSMREVWQAVHVQLVTLYD